MARWIKRAVRGVGPRQRALRIARRCARQLARCGGGCARQRRRLLGGGGARGAKQGCCIASAPRARTARQPRHGSPSGASLRLASCLQRCGQERRGFDALS
jgi:hypothetical protein